MLTDVQYTALATDVLVSHQSEFATAVANNDYQALADAYNALASPAYWVWRTFVPASELYGVTTADGTTWSWVAYGNQPAVQQNAWMEMMTGSGGQSASRGLNLALPNTRQGITDIFSGTGLNATQRTHCFTAGRRPATRLERLFATGTGSTASPGTMAKEGALTYADAAHAVGGVPL